MAAKPQTDPVLMRFRAALTEIYGPRLTRVVLFVSRTLFILNMTDAQAAHDMLEELPAGKAHLMTFQLTPIGPLNPLHQLLKVSLIER
jgi:hypothetical protein